MPVARPTRVEKRAQTRRRVLDAAAVVFPQHGFHRTTVEQVAAAAGLSIGAVYSNFDGKAGLFLALYERHMDRWVAELEASVESARDAVGRARAVAAYWLRFYEEERDWFVLHMEFWGHVMRHPALQEPYAQQFRRLRAATADVLTAHAAETGAALPCSADDVALLLQALNRGLLVEAYADPGGFRPELVSALAEGVASVVDAGLVQG